MLNIVLLKNIRADIHFFWPRLIIGLFLAFSIHFSKIVDSARVIEEIADKQGFMILLSMVLCGLMSIIYLHKPRGPRINTVRRGIALFSKALFLFIRGAFIMGIAALICCMIIDRNPTLILTSASFLWALEFMTYIDFQYDRLEKEAEKSRKKEPSV